MSTFPHRHLLGTEGLPPADLLTILDLGERFLEINERPIKKVPTLRGKTVVNLFLEPSTRTRTSFEIAAKRLSADAVNISGSGSSTVKGETLMDTAKNVDAMAPDVVVLRHAQAGAAAMLAGRIRAGVVNAGDGAHEHPTRALLDCSTIRAHKGRCARSAPRSAWPARARCSPPASPRWAPSCTTASSPRSRTPTSS